MKALILFGSPRKKNTYKITQSFVKGLEDKGCEINFVNVTRLNISHCKACDYCLKNKGCIIKDDMEVIYRLVEESDIIVLASPVYFGTVSSYLKVLIDRCQPLYNKRFVLKEESKKKEGVLIFTAGGKNKRMIDSMELVAKFFMLSCNANLKDIIYELDLDANPLTDDSEVFKIAYQKALNIVV